MASAVYRGSTGVVVVPRPGDEESKFVLDQTKSCRVFVFSPDGALFAFYDGSGVKIHNTETWSEVAKLPVTRAHALEFSPEGSYLATWEQYRTTPDNPVGERNLVIWDRASGFGQAAAFHQKKFQLWCPQWSRDEAVCSRMVNNEVQFYAGGEWGKIAHKIHQQKVANYGMAGGGDGGVSVATFVPGLKGQPCFVRIYKYPNFEGPGAVLAQKSFYKAENVEFKWNCKGTSVLTVAQTEVDDTGASYYGQTSLHYLDTSGETCMVQLAKKGPIYAVEWNPSTGSEFCVVYGFMPATATLFSRKCEPVFEFKTGKRNAVYFNPFGNMLILAGFGNLRGNVEVWGLDGAERGKSSPKLAAQFNAPDSTLLQWGPDGASLLTATCSPRLKIGNGYKFWDYHGKLLSSVVFPDGQEIWEAKWRPAAPGTLGAPRVEYLADPTGAAKGGAGGTGTGDAQPAPQPYRPPMARNQPVKPFKLHHSDDEEGPAVQISKSAQKNKKKRENKKVNKQQRHGEEAGDEAEGNESVMGGQGKGGANGVAEPDPELGKKIRNLEKKLQQIQKIKTDRDAGKTLELNQIQKLEKEEEFLQELEKLKV